MARKRPLNLAYRELRARYRALAASTKKQIAVLQRQADEGEMNGMCIMECRDYIEKHLGVNCVRLPGLHIGSPFFDDIVMGLVNAIKYYHGQVMQHVTSPVVQAMQAQQAASQQQLTHLAIHGASQTPISTTNPIYQVGTATNTITFASTQVTSVNVYLTTASANQTTNVLGIGTPATSGTAMGYGHGATNSLAAPSDMYLEWADVNIEVKDGQKRRIKLPDGTIIETQVDGSYTLTDTDAKVIYRANRVREFNRFINASDLMAQFVEFCGKEAGVGRGEFLDLPLKLFIGYLITEAAKADGEPEPKDIKLLPDLRDWVDKYQQQTHQPVGAAA